MTAEYFVESLWWHRPHTSSKEFNLDQRGLAFALGSWEVIFMSRNILPDRSCLCLPGGLRHTRRSNSATLGWGFGSTWPLVSGAHSMQLTVSTWESPKKTLDTKVQISFCSWETHTDPGRIWNSASLHLEFSWTLIHYLPSSGCL